MSPLEWIRRFIYKAGFDPNPGTVFFSPSLSMTIAASQAMKVATKALDVKNDVQFIDERPGNHRLNEDMPTTILSLDGVPQTLISKAKYCPLCGVKLQTGANNVKTCPYFHGLGYISDDSDGLPVLMFEIYEP